jgi:hypothetical protein
LTSDVRKRIDYPAAAIRESTTASCIRPLRDPSSAWFHYRCSMYTICICVYIAKRVLRRCTRSPCVCSLPSVRRTIVFIISSTLAGRVDIIFSKVSLDTLPNNSRFIRARVCVCVRSTCLCAHCIVTARRHVHLIGVKYGYRSLRGEFALRMTTRPVHVLNVTVRTCYPNSVWRVRGDVARRSVWVPAVDRIR